MPNAPQVDPRYAPSQDYGSISSLSDQDLDYLIKQQDALNAQLQTLSDEELENLFRVYTAPDGTTTEEAPTVDTPPPELSAGEALAGGARELAGGALFEFSDEAEAAARAPFSDFFSSVIRWIIESALVPVNLLRNCAFRACFQKSSDQTVFCSSVSAAKLVSAMAGVSLMVVEVRVGCTAVMDQR